MFVLPEKIKKPTRFLLFLNGIKALVIFIIINALFFFGFFLMNSFIGVLYIVFVFLLSVILTAPSQKNPDRIFIETIIFDVLKRKEFDSDEKNVFKEKIQQARKQFTSFDKSRRTKKIKKIRF